MLSTQFIPIDANLRIETVVQEVKEELYAVIEESKSSETLVSLKAKVDLLIKDVLPQWMRDFEVDYSVFNRKIRLKNKMFYTAVYCEYFLEIAKFLGKITNFDVLNYLGETPLIKILEDYKAVSSRLARGHCLADDRESHIRHTKALEAMLSVVTEKHVNAKDYRGETAFTIACLGYLQVPNSIFVGPIALLMRAGADIHARTNISEEVPKNATILIAAIQYYQRFYTYVLKLLLQDVDLTLLNAKADDGTTALSLACSYGMKCYYQIKEFITEGADVKTQHGDYTVLDLWMEQVLLDPFIQGFHLEIICMLLCHGAIANKYKEKLETIIKTRQEYFYGYLCDHYHHRELEYVLDENLGVSALNKIIKSYVFQNPLSSALSPMEELRIDLVDMMKPLSILDDEYLKKNISNPLNEFKIAVTNKYSETDLKIIPKKKIKEELFFKAVGSGNHDLVQALINLKVDVNAKDEKGNTALDWLAITSSKNIKLTYILISYGAVIAKMSLDFVERNLKYINQKFAAPKGKSIEIINGMDGVRRCIMFTLDEKIPTSIFKKLPKNSSKSIELTDFSMRKSKPR